jgi:CRP-like cAMP-binding protein
MCRRKNGCCGVCFELAESYDGRGGEIPLTQEQLAELAGTSRATVNKVLRDEQERGAVELRRSHDRPPTRAA